MARGAVEICMMACRNPTTTTNHDEWFECENGPHLCIFIQFMRANATEEMRRVLGAKAANVQLAVPPMLAAGDWSVDSEGDGEGSRGDLHDGVSESDDNN